MIKEKKSQASLEFLMTYGWAFLIVVVIVAGFMYLGVLRPDQYIAERCMPSQGFNCLEFNINENGADEVILTINIRNMLGKKITLSELSGVTSDLCRGDCTIVSTNPNLVGYEIQAGDSLTFDTTISVPGGMPGRQKMKFNYEIEYLEDRKDFPKFLLIELFAELRTN
jgi:hypothetical protein